MDDVERYIMKQLEDIPMPVSQVTIMDIFRTMNDDQKRVLYFMVGHAIEETKADVRRYLGGK